MRGQLGDTRNGNRLRPLLDGPRLDGNARLNTDRDSGGDRNRASDDPRTDVGLMFTDPAAEPLLRAALVLGHPFQEKPSTPRGPVLERLTFDLLRFRFGHRTLVDNAPTRTTQHQSAVTVYDCGHAR